MISLSAITTILFSAISSPHKEDVAAHVSTPKSHKQKTFAQLEAEYYQILEEIKKPDPFTHTVTLCEHVSESQICNILGGGHQYEVLTETNAFVVRTSSCNRAKLHLAQVVSYS